MWPNSTQLLDTKYEEDTLMRSKVMARLVWKSEAPLKFGLYFQKKGLETSYVTKLCTWRRFNYVFKSYGNFKFKKFDEILKKWKVVSNIIFWPNQNWPILVSPLIYVRKISVPTDIYLCL